MLEFTYVIECIYVQIKKKTDKIFLLYFWPHESQPVGTYAVNRL